MVAARTQDKPGKDDESVLPPGQRDRSGFWYPEGYADPATLVRRRPRRVGTTGEPDTPEDLTDPS